MANQELARTNEAIVPQEKEAYGREGLLLLIDGKINEIDAALHDSKMLNKIKNQEELLNNLKAKEDKSENDASSGNEIAIFKYLIIIKRNLIELAKIIADPSLEITPHSHLSSTLGNLEMAFGLPKRVGEGKTRGEGAEKTSLMLKEYNEYLFNCIKNEKFLTDALGTVLGPKQKLRKFTLIK